MRLIDADELKESLNDLEVNSSDCHWKKEVENVIFKLFPKIIDEQPTAYNVDKVVEQLEDYLFEKYCVEGENDVEKIVKAGGVNE